MMWFRYKLYQLCLFLKRDHKYTLQMRSVEHERSIQLRNNLNYLKK